MQKRDTHDSLEKALQRQQLKHATRLLINVTRSVVTRFIALTIPANSGILERQQLYQNLAKTIKSSGRKTHLDMLKRS